MAPIVARFANSPQLLYRAQMAVFRNMKTMRRGGIFVVVIFPLFMIGLQLVRGVSVSQAVFTQLPWVVGFPLIWLVGIPVLQRWSAYRAFRVTPAAQGDRQYTFDESQISVATALSSSALDWRAIVRFVETPELFLLFLNQQAAHFIPKSAFASNEDLTRFRTLLENKVH